MLQTSICARAPAGNRAGWNRAGWNDARVDLLKQLWADGLTASQIAERLGEVTRNAVIGKVHRLGLAGRATTSRKPLLRRTSPHRDRASRVSMRKPVPRSRSCPATPDRLPPAPAALTIALADLAGSSCHWPVGDPREPGFGFCGAKIAAGRQPYCAAHQHIGHELRRAR